MKKRIVSLMLVFSILATLIVALPTTASAASGICGDNLTWTLDESGTLTISGTGDMDNYDKDDSPWYNYAESIKTLVINEGVISIGIGAFCNCRNLTDITIANTVNCIGSSAFSGSSSIKTVNIPAGVTQIMDFAFTYCDSLATINVDKSNEDYCSVDGILFSKDKTELICYPGAKEDRSYNIPDSVKRIAGGAFSANSYIETVTVPESVTDIGSESFSWNDTLSSIDVNSLNAHYCSDDGVLFNKDKTELVAYPCGKNSMIYQIPEGTKIIGESSFEGSKLTNIVIPNTVERIDYGAFCNSNLVSVTIPDSVQFIDDWAFAYCLSMINVFIGTGVTFIGYDAFSGCECIDNVYYGGDDTSWMSIDVTEGNDCLTNAAMHFGATEIEDSNIIHVTSVDALQSKHPYANNTDKTWIYTYPDNADYLYVTFSEDTETESGYDFVYIYDIDDNQIGKYSGTELAGQTIEVSGNVVKIQLTSDSSMTCNGFIVTNIDAVLSSGTITNLKYLYRTRTTATLSFSNPKEAENVVVEQSFDGVTWVTATTKEVLNASSTTATVTGLKSGTQYYFRINVVGGIREGISNEINLTTYPDDDNENEILTPEYKFIKPLDAPMPIANTNGFIAPISSSELQATKITNPEELAQITEGKYVLENDIYLGDYNDGIWIPIEPTGEIILDGQGHKIYDLNIPETENIEYAGLIGESKYSVEIKNLGLKTFNDSVVIAGIFAGGFLGACSSVDKIKLYNCFSSINVISQSKGGGLIGNADNYLSEKQTVDIQYCHYSGEVVSNRTAGGLIGTAGACNGNDIEISVAFCYNNGNVSSVDGDAGGIVSSVYKENDVDNKTILQYYVINSYNTGNVNGYYGASGIGSTPDELNDTITINNCFNQGKIEAHYDASGLILGDVNSAINCYNANDIIGETLSYGSGIATVADNVEYCYNTGAIKATTTIGLIAYNSDRGRTIIKGCYNNGDLYNAGHIGGMIGYASREGDVSIIDCYNAGNIVGSTHDSGFTYAGGIVGESNANVDIKNCYNTGNISGYISTASGLIGCAANITILESFNEGNIDVSGNNIGGLVGHSASNRQGTIEINSSFNKGDITIKSTSDIYCAGLSTIGASIKNSYNTGDINVFSTKAAYVGGLIGIDDDGYGATSKANIENSYNTGTVSAITDGYYGACVGGIIGKCQYTANITSCHNTGNVFSQSNPENSYGSSCSGGIVGRGNSTIIGSYNTGSITSRTDSANLVYAGGIIGSGSGTMERCRSIGQINGSEATAGGLIGYINGDTEFKPYNYYAGAERAIGTKTQYATVIGEEYIYEIKLLPNTTRTISAGFTGGQDIVYNADNNIYSTDSFMLIGTIENLSMLDDDKREDYSAHNVKVELTLPDGYSFSKDYENKNVSYTFNEILSRISTTNIVYLNKPSVGKSQLSVKITGDNITEKTFTYDFNVDSYAFQVDIYRANYLMNSKTGEVMENTYINIDRTPCKILYDAGQENGLDNAVNAWNTVMDTLNVIDKPSSIADYAFEEKDMYEAIIMSLFESSVDYKVMGYVNGEITKQTKNLFSQITSQMKNKYNFDMLDGTNLKNLTDKQRQEVAEDMAEYFKNDYQNAALVSKGVGFISDALKYANDFQSLCEKVSAYYNILRLGDSMKQIMQDMYNKCPNDNLALKQALRDCISIMNLSDDEFTQRMLVNLIGLTGKNVAQAGLDEFWSSVKTTFSVAHPAAFIFQAAYAAGKYVTQVCFNADSIAEKYCNIVAILNVEKVLDSIYTNKKTGFINNKTQLNAEIYNSMVDVMFNMINTDCDYAISYLNAIDNSLASKLSAAFGDSTVEDTRKSVKSIQSSSDLFHVSVLTDWIAQLYEDDINKYYEYEHLIDESYENYRKKYNINCPVDLYVYDKDGVIVGSVVNNVPYCRNDANITVAVEGDRKTIYMYGDDEYDIVYKGNDTGTMDITVTEYDETAATSRSVYFNNLELSDGKEYTSTETGTTAAENAYLLSNESGENIVPDYDTQTSSDEVYTATIERGYFVGSANVTEELHKGETAEIAAYVPEGYEFAGWTSDAEDDIFDDASSIMTKIAMPNYDVTIKANVIERPTVAISEITDSSVTVKAINCDDITEGTVILAIYNESGVLEQIKTEDFAKELTFTDLTLGSGTAKAMLWDSVDNMIPLAKSTKKMFCFESEEKDVVESKTLSVPEITDSSVTVRAINCDDITDGTVILAIYNDNGTLEQLKVEDFEEEITFNNLKLTSGTAKVMLWDSLNNLIPLAKSTEKRFYFETTETE